MKDITPEQVVKILAKEGTVVTLEEAKTILSLMTDLANITLDDIFNSYEQPPKPERKTKKKD